MPLMTIRLELARQPGFPEGSQAHGYEFVAPLTADGHLDAAHWRENAKACTVRRFWGQEAEQHGRRVHHGRNWAFDYDFADDDDDEPVFKLDRHAISEGEYLSVTEHDGRQMTFRIASVRPVR